MYCERLQFLMATDEFTDILTRLLNWSAFEAPYAALEKAVEPWVV